MDRKKLICHLKLAFCIMATSYVQLLIGCTYSFTSNFLAELRLPSSNFKFDTEQESWITSIPVLVCPLSLPIVGIIMDNFGRRLALQIIYMPMIASWAIFAYVHSYESFMFARMILGITYCSSSCFMVYMAEVCPTYLRPIYGSAVVLFVGLGMLIECVLSSYYPWSTMAVVLFVASVAGFVPLCLVREPPVWLESRGRTDQAREAAGWFDVRRISDAEKKTSAVGSKIHDDDRHLQSDLDDEDDRKNTGDCGKDVDRYGQNVRVESPSYWSLYMDRTVWMPTLLLGLIFTTQQIGGVYVLLFYASEILRDYKMPWDKITVNKYLAISRLLGSLTLMAMHRVKYRVLLIVSGTGMAVSIGIVVVYLKTVGWATVNPDQYSAIPVVGFFSYMYFALLGMMSVPWIICGELFPIAVRGTMSGVMNTWGYVLWFVMVKIYPSLVWRFGTENVWTVFAISCLLTALCTQLILPETKGRSLDEILSYFQPRKKNKKCNSRVP
ncbi:Hypothetical protein CINCED_3A003549 [Cinara cedri]|nr:Hypothetical protein CINCED_3A003549 [Cinara cedri]